MFYKTEYKSRPNVLPLRSYNSQLNYKEGDRFFLAAPFLFGALAGGAIASVSRPRPVYVNQPVPYYNPAYPSGSTSYNYYYPAPYPR